MPYITLKLPPGMSKPGTVYDARGRWYSGSLVRWYEGSLQPYGGWAPMQTSAAADVNVSNPVRKLLAWRDNVQQPTLAIGTNAGLHLLRAGILSNITPATFTAGLVDADEEDGQYGAGPYGEGAYGFGLEGVGTPVDAATWTLDNYGQALVACAPQDTRVVWKLVPSTCDVAVVIPNSPAARAVVVTPERFIVALAAYDGTSINERMVAWCDQENPTVWAPLSTNQAGDFILSTPGRILAGRRLTQETLIWTDADLWRMRFIGGQLVYSFQSVGSYGAVSRHAMAILGGRAFWMGNRAFYAYDGFVQPIPCEVADYVFGDLNRAQISKVVTRTQARFGEVTWHYPSGGSLENDRYVTLNTLTGAWYVGELERTAGEDAEVFGFPIQADAQGNVYQHEIRGGTYLDVDGTTPLVPFVESGPVELGQGDLVMYVREIIPDMEGTVTAKIMASSYPVTNEATFGPFTLDSPTPTRLSGRQVRLRLDGDSSDWRVGSFRLEVVPGGLR
jgi:hypothetical protein